MPADAKWADFIWGRSIPDLRARSTCQRPTHKLAHIPVNLPPALYGNHKNMTLNIDFFYVNCIAVLRTILNCLTFRSVDFPPSRSEAQIMYIFNKIKRIYEAHGFKIVDLHGDNEFTKIQDTIIPTNLTLAAAREHVGPVECSVRVMKENSCACLYGTPFKQVPIVMIKGLLKLATILLNAFPSKAGISETLSPTQHCTRPPKHRFHSVANTQAGRTRGALVLYPRGKHRSWAFLSLNTGK